MITGPCFSIMSATQGRIHGDDVTAIVQMHEGPHRGGERRSRPGRRFLCRSKNDRAARAHATAKDACSRGGFSQAAGNSLHASCKDAGFTAHLVKPVPFDQLRALLDLIATSAPHV